MSGKGSRMNRNIQGRSKLLFSSFKKEFLRSVWDLKTQTGIKSALAWQKLFPCILIMFTQNEFQIWNQLLFKTNSGYESGDQKGSFDEKTRNKKYHTSIPLRHHKDWVPATGPSDAAILM